MLSHSLLSNVPWNILSKFPTNISFCFAYGSGVKKQLGYPDTGKDARRPMIDLVFCVNDALEWHRANMQLNSSHYSAVRLLGTSTVACIQTQFGAKVYCNTLIPMDDGTTIKYGVVTTTDLKRDLIDWTHLYLAGRLHKPIEILHEPEAHVRNAIETNFVNAVHVSMCLLPERFTYFDLFYTIANLSYAGDFRMIFGENKDKVKNIVAPQLADFIGLYTPILKSHGRYLSLPTHESHPLIQDKSEAAILHHLKHLPKTLQHRIFRSNDVDESVVEHLSKNPNLHQIVQKSVNQIVWNSSVSQSLKNIPTAGLSKAVRYSWKKALKTLGL